MREKQKPRILKLAKETVRRLLDPELERIGAGSGLEYNGPWSLTVCWVC